MRERGAFHTVVVMLLHNCVMQDASEAKDRELAAVRQKLSALESDTQSRICDLETQLADALSSAAEAAAAAASGEMFE